MGNLSVGVRIGTLALDRALKMRKVKIEGTMKSGSCPLNVKSENRGNDKALIVPSKREK